MTALLFDTLRLSRSLRDKGHFTPDQAEALAEALGEASQDNLATKLDIATIKTDMAALKTELKTDMAALKTELKTDMAALKTELKTDMAALKTEIATVRAEIHASKTDVIKWTIGAVGFQTVVIVGAAVTLARIFVR